MKHMLRDEDFESKLRPGVTAFSCEFDSGKRVRSFTLTLGDDCNVIFLPCRACMAQLEQQILKPLIVESLKIKHGTD